MNPRQRGFLLLTGYLGNPDRHPLTIAQFRELTKLARQMEKPLVDKELNREELVKIGCDGGFADRVIALLSAEEELDWYLQSGKKRDCAPITRLDDLYPARLRKCLALDAPACIWVKGNRKILQNPMVALVGSRELLPENLAFAEEAGKQAAMQGYTLVSGNAKGADQVAQNSCLSYGGSVISIVADRLDEKPLQDNVLYVSDEGYDLPFSSVRALSRNRLIHAMTPKTFVAQCSLEKGGTWNGTTQNLRFGWSDVFCFDDGSEAAAELQQRGAVGVKFEDLTDIESLQSNILELF